MTTAGSTTEPRFANITAAFEIVVTKIAIVEAILAAAHVVVTILGTAIDIGRALCAVRQAVAARLLADLAHLVDANLVPLRVATERIDGTNLAHAFVTAHR